MALGKNLGSILGDYFGDESITLNNEKEKENNPIHVSVDENASSVTPIEINKIELGPFQTRSDFNEERIQGLAKSIEKSGLLSPVVVLRKVETSDNGIQTEKFVLLAGERRLRACQSLGHKEVLAVIKHEKKLPEKEQALITAVENLQREDLNPIDLAYTFRMLMETQELNEEQLAKSLGYSSQYVKNYLRLLTLDKTVQQALIDRKIGEGQARHLVTMTPEDQTIMLNIIIKNDMTVKEITQYLKQKKLQAEPIQGQQQPKEKPSYGHNLSPQILRKAQNLAEVFPDAKMKCQGDSEKGKIVISWG